MSKKNNNKEINKEVQWTSTTERPPADFQKVLIQTLWGEMDVLYYIPPRVKPATYFKGYWSTSSNGDGVDYDYFQVEAWYPLPRRYHGEDYISVDDSEYEIDEEYRE